MIRAIALLFGFPLLALGAGTTAGDKEPAEFITEAGNYSLFDGKLVLKISEGAAGTGYTFTRPLGEGLSTSTGSTQDRIKKGANWFIYPESVSKAWVFTGTNLELWEFDDKEGHGKTKTSSASMVPGIVRAAPAPVRNRLPDEYKKKYPDK